MSRVVEERGGDVEHVFAALMYNAGDAYLGDMLHPLGTAARSAHVP